MKGPWIQTFTGRKVHILDPNPADIVIEDIAHSLSLLCRFTGHVRRFWSVAQHSLLVASFVPESLQLAALLHDATEAYLGDMNKPLKDHMADYQAAEKVMALCIAERFKIPARIHPLIKRADLIALATERRDLMGPPPAPWGIDDLGIEPHPSPLSPVDPETAERWFLDEYRHITKE